MNKQFTLAFLKHAMILPLLRIQLPLGMFYQELNDRAEQIWSV